MPTGIAVRAALGQLSEQLVRSGVKIAHGSPLLPDLADSARVYMRLLYSFLGAIAPRDVYEGMRRSAEALAPDDHSLTAERTRSAVTNHRDWFAADVARARLRQQWSIVFREWDVVLCPVMATPAIPHDHSLPIEARDVEIDGKGYGVETSRSRLIETRQFQRHHSS
jgi:amidase